MQEDKEFIRAKGYAYRLLSYRQRSAKEINERLKKRGFSAQIIKKTVGYLSGLNYLNDENFARVWIQSKLQSSPVGWPLLRYQLRQKGIAEQITEKALSETAGQYDEYEAVRRLAASRRKRYKGLEPMKIKRRLYGYLRRRGFSQEAILEAIK